ncbi:hypothetical protein AVEN_42474-1 [Araneus ventricosus]|uniref:Uncharacterized protein n=1 Tax=Araneus ventricosus TaxID=182803 RepID=A0A4Y2MZB7_ARAVE|nr:hypothetical protein AVEN_42474-1 [Araneus ventricosus]
MESYWETRGRTKSDRSGQVSESPSLVHRLRQKFLTTYSAFRRFSQGRPTATTSADDRYLSLCAQRNRTATPIQLGSSLATATRRLASTVRRRLHEGGLYARRPAI